MKPADCSRVWLQRLGRPGRRSLCECAGPHRWSHQMSEASRLQLVMRPSSLGGGRILRRTLSVRLSVRPVSGCTLFTVAPSYERISKIEKLRFSLMGQRHVCTFRHVQRAAYRTPISAAQILVYNQHNIKIKNTEEHRE